MVTTVHLLKRTMNEAGVLLVLQRQSSCLSLGQSLQKGEKKKKAISSPGFVYKMANYEEQVSSTKQGVTQEGLYLKVSNNINNHKCMLTILLFYSQVFQILPTFCTIFS